MILLYSRYIVSNIGRVNEMARMMSAGDFTGLIEVKSTDEFGQMAHNFNTMTESLKTMLSRVAGHTHHVASTSEELTASAEQTSKATEANRTSHSGSRGQASMEEASPLSQMR
ncbi:HAMP domain-containing protein [Aneurinibacillus tyrosinisolvens]|uniref:HAMP domain-containing protein n=1 Tax=Aneurinibacillus tyrosinisolvens TaxID=1443435 RepID=UPI0022A8F841|nr:HAMP domain-containing protein [Aneurinibacillus tyrosinisolvens]